MVRIAFLFAGCVNAAETGSLMQSHNADLGMSLDMNFKLSKLADLQLTTKRMESEYKAMAEAMIKKQFDPATGNPYADAHNKDIWTTVDEQFNVLLWQLDEEKATNTQLIQGATKRVNDCNDARNAAFDEPQTGVKARLKALEDTRNLHRVCRGQENTAIAKRGESCGQFVAKNLCDAHENRYQYFAKTGNDVPTEVLEAVASAKVCRSDLAAEVAKSASCDVAQRTFETAFCQYGEKLTDTCTELDVCRERTVRERDAVVAGVSELEANQKIVYRMVQKVKCYVTAMRGKFKTLTQRDIQNCEDENHTAGADNALSVPKVPPQPKAPCSLAVLDNGLPGAGSWVTAEYTGLTAHHGNTYNGTHDAVDQLQAQSDCSTLLA